MTMTAEEITKLVAEGIAAGLKAHAEANPPVTAETVGKIVADQLGGLDVAGQVAAASQKIIDDAAAEAAKRQQAKPKGDQDPVEVARLRQADEIAAQIKELKAAQIDAESARATAVAKERETMLTTQLGAALSAVGITPERHAQAMPYLRAQTSSHSNEPTIGYDGDKLIFRIPKKGYEDKVSVKDGIRQWAGTAEAKLYMPPASAQGNGNGGGDGRRGGGSAGARTFAELKGQLPVP